MNGDVGLAALVEPWQRAGLGDIRRLGRRIRLHANLALASASWIDQVARSFGLLADGQSRRHAHGSVRERGAATIAGIEVRNADPLRSVKSAGGFKVKAQPVCPRTIVVQEQSA